MAGVEVRWADKHLQYYAEQLEQLYRENPVVLPRIINSVGNRAKTQVIRNLVKQTGLPRTTLVKAIGNPARANGRQDPLMLNCSQR